MELLFSFHGFLCMCTFVCLDAVGSNSICVLDLGTGLWSVCVFSEWNDGVFAPIGCCGLSAQTRGMSQTSWALWLSSCCLERGTVCRQSVGYLRNQWSFFERVLISGLYLNFGFPSGLWVQGAPGTLPGGPTKWEFLPSQVQLSCCWNCNRQLPIAPFPWLLRA